MEPHHEIHRALDVLRGARSFAIESFKRNFPGVNVGHDLSFKEFFDPRPSWKLRYTRPVCMGTTSTASRHGLPLDTFHEALLLNSVARYA